MRCCVGLPLCGLIAMLSVFYRRSIIAGAVAAVAVSVIVLAALLRIYLTLAPNESFALLRHSTFLAQPSTSHVRFRASEYGTARHDRFFFQWWNYLVIDSLTNEQFQFVFQLNYHSERFQADPSAAYLLVAAKAQHGDGSVTYESADSLPLHQAELSRDMDISAPWYSQAAEDDNTYTFTAAFPANRSKSGLPLSFHITLHRVHGMYSGLDSEESSVRHCLISSNVFAFNSRVSGWWSSSADHNVSFSASSPRFRAYAGASWGCQLPHTDHNDPLHYPWTWVWMSVPQTDSRPDLSISIGTASFDLGLAGRMRAGLMAVGWGDEVVGATYATINSDGIVPLPLLSAASDGPLSAFAPNLSDWTSSSSSMAASIDPMGSFTLPLTQSYFISTGTLELTFTSRSPNLSAYFRAPIVVEDATSAQVRLYSDFRANAVEVHVRLVRKGGEVEEVLYDGEAAINAVEYAYEAELLESAESILGRVSSGRGWKESPVEAREL